MALNIHLDEHLKRTFGATGYTVSGATASLPSANVSHSVLAQLDDVAYSTGHMVSLVAGVLTIKPR